MYHRAFAKHEIRLRARFRQQKTPARTGASGCFQLGQKKSPLSRTVTFFYQLGVRLVNFLKRRKVDDILGDSSVALVGKSCIGTSREHIRSSHTKAGGQELVQQIELPTGHASRPISTEEIRQKFMLNAEPVLGSQHAGEIASMVLDLENLPNLAALMDRLATRN